MSERVDDGGRLSFSDAVVAGIPINNRRQSVSPVGQVREKGDGRVSRTRGRCSRSTYEYDCGFVTVGQCVVSWALYDAFRSQKEGQR